MPVTSIKNIKQFEDLFSKSGSKYVFVDFYTSWCGPCRRIAPTIEKLSTDSKYSGVNFVKVDIDIVTELQTQYNVTSIPTFMLFDGATKKRVGFPVEGANEKAVVSLLNNTTTSSSF